MSRVVTNLGLPFAARCGVAHLAGSAVELRRSGAGWLVETLSGLLLGCCADPADVRASGNPRPRLRTPRPEWGPEALRPLSSSMVRRGLQVVSASGPSAALRSGRDWLALELHPGPASSLRMVLLDVEVLALRRRGARRVGLRTVSVLARALGSWVVLQRSLWLGGDTGRCGCSSLLVEVASGEPVRVLLTFDDVRGFRPRLHARLGVDVAYEFNFACPGDVP